MGLEFKSKDKKYILPFIVILLIAAYNISSYIQYETRLKKMRGAEWITYDAENRLYFTYQGNIYRLSADNVSLDNLVETGLKISSKDILDIDVARSGDIFLTDPMSREVHVYSNSGTLKYSLKGHFRENARIVVDDERIYIADMQGNKIIALDIEKGEILWTDENYFIPDSLFIRNSILYVSDKDKQEVRLLNAKNGHVIKTINVNFKGFDYGSSILVLDDGNILLSSAYTRNGILKKFSDDGKLIQTINGPDGFTPVDMAVSPEGNIIITDDENYSFYQINNNAVELVNFKNIEQLYGDVRKERAKLKKNSLYSQASLTACAIFLVGLFISYRRYE